MFGIGWGEMVVVGLVALVVVGPEKLPDIARTVGRFYAQIRRATAEAKDIFEQEVRREQAPPAATPPIKPDPPEQP